MEQVVKIIEDIAERSEILAFNATLEAGGTGEAGGRLSVVATDMARLSERITEQVTDIKLLFRDVRTSSAEIVQAIEVGRERAQQGPERIKKIKASIARIEGRARSATASMNEIVKMADGQSRALTQMQIMVSEILSVAAIIDEISLSAENTVDRLNKLAEHLKSLVAGS